MAASEPAPDSDPGQSWLRTEKLQFAQGVRAARLVITGRVGVIRSLGVVDGAPPAETRHHD